MKKIIILLLVLTTGCSIKDYISYRLPPLMPKSSIKLTEDVSQNKKIYDSLYYSSDQHDILDLIEFADYFSDSIFLFKTLKNSNKVDYLIFDLGYYTTPGERAFNKIIESDKYLKTPLEKIRFSLNILSSEKLYHLHDLAGVYLAEIVDKQISFDDFYNSYLKEKPFYESGYVLTRMNQKCQDDFSDNFTLNEEQENQILGYMQNDIIPITIKKYLLEYIYSINYKLQRGESLNAKIRSLNLDANIQEFNSALFRDYVLYKPVYEKLDSIHTWMEMDKNISSIKTFLNNKSLILFYQLLYFNPSTVLESKKLCRQKLKSIKSMVYSANRESYYYSYRLTFKNELDVKDNYDIRFIKNIYSRKKFNALLKRIIK